MVGGRGWCLAIAGLWWASACAEPPSLPTQLAAQADATCLLRDGDVTCWGARRWLWTPGSPTAEEWMDPSFVLPPMDLGRPAVAIDVGDEHACAVLDDGSVTCWGRDGHDGRLGATDPGVDHLGYTSVDAPFVSVSAGTAHTCAVTSSGELWCWGTAAFLGLPFTPPEPGEMYTGLGQVMLDERVVAVAAANETCALLEGGAVRCWNGNYEPGQGAPASCRPDPSCDESTPCCITLLPHEIDDVDLGGPAVELVSDSHHCARLEDGQVRCWGYNSYGQLGLGHTEMVGDDETPAAGGRVPLDEPAIALAADGRRTCAVLASGALRCWGLGDEGVLGLADVTNLGDDESILDVPAITMDAPVEQVALGWRHACVLMGDDVRCWGWREDGLLGTRPDLDHCIVEVPNPNAELLCELPTIWEYRCDADGSCCIGDDETTASAVRVPL